MKTIPLTKGMEAQVDDDDYTYLMQWKWRAQQKGGKLYATRRARNSEHHPTYAVLMHAVVLFRSGRSAMMVDHKDGNGLNNCRDNLRPASKRENARNRGRPSWNTSGFKGVSFDKSRQKWAANIKIETGQKHLGRFDTPEAAARAYDEAAKKYFGEFAYLNYSGTPATTPLTTEAA